MKLISYDYHNHIYSYGSLGLGLESIGIVFEDSIFKPQMYLLGETDSIMLLWK